MVSVYADVLVSVNILITYIFIVCVRVVFGAPTGKWFVVLASFIGGLSSIVILFDDGGFIFGIVFKALVSAVITAVAFMPRSLKGFLKLYGGFFGVSLLFGGAVYFVQITLKPHNVYMKNGAVYFDMSVTYLIGIVFSVYGLFVLFQWLWGKHTAKNNIYTVTIIFRECAITLNGFVDTGNSLCDALSGNPVFVVSRQRVSPLFNYDEIRFLKGECTAAPPDSLKKYYRVLPCGTVTGNSLLPAFVPHKVVLQNGNSRATAEKVTIAISPEGIGDGDCDVLLNKSVYDMDWKESKNGKSIFNFNFKA